jgi:hypothetical protein
MESSEFTENYVRDFFVFQPRRNVVNMPFIKKHIPNRLGMRFHYESRSGFDECMGSYWMFDEFAVVGNSPFRTKEAALGISNDTGRAENPVLSIREQSLLKTAQDIYQIGFDGKLVSHTFRQETVFGEGQLVDTSTDKLRLPENFAMIQRLWKFKDFAFDFEDSELYQARIALKKFLPDAFPYSPGMYGS